MTATTRPPTHSVTYQLFARAIAERKQILCLYDGDRREICPVILGHKSGGEEVALAYQFAGRSKRPLPDWRCFRLSGVSEVRLRVGPWHAGSSHRQKQRCVDIVEFDVNPDSPYDPEGRL